MAKDLLKIENVYFAFTSIAEPVFKFESKIEKEFKTTAILSQEQARDFKRLKLNKTVKEIETSVFKEKMKFDPPYPDQFEQFAITVSRRATYKDGNPTPDWTYPKSYFQKDGTILENTSVLIGNGSFGDLRLDPSYNEKAKSTNIALHSLLVKEHVPYEKKGDEWATPASAVRVPSVDSRRDAPTPDLDLDDDLPF